MPTLYNYSSNAVNNFRCLKIYNQGGRFSLMNMSARLATERRAAGLSQSQLADKSGISQQMISKLERGVSESTREIIALAAALNLNPEWLKSGIGQKEANGLADPAEQELIRNYRASDTSRRQAILIMSRMSSSTNNSHNMGH